MFKLKTYDIVATNPRTGESHTLGRWVLGKAKQVLEDGTYEARHPEQGLRYCFIVARAVDGGEPDILIRRPVAETRPMMDPLQFDPTARFLRAWFQSLDGEDLALVTGILMNGTPEQIDRFMSEVNRVLDGFGPIAFMLGPERWRPDVALMVDRAESGSPQPPVLAARRHRESRTGAEAVTD